MVCSGGAGNARLEASFLGRKALVTSESLMASTAPYWMKITPEQTRSNKWITIIYTPDGPKTGTKIRNGLPRERRRSTL
jgi:hypothetical protein